jgi:hypothetical protein
VLNCNKNDIPRREELDKDRFSRGLRIIVGNREFSSIGYVGHKADECNNRESHFDDIG